MSTAPALLARARAAGLTLWLDGAAVRFRAAREPPPELLAGLRQHKDALAAVLRGDCCGGCGRPMPWPRPCGVVLGDGTSRCFACYERAEVARVIAASHRAVAPRHAADPAEVTLRGEADD